MNELGSENFTTQPVIDRKFPRPVKEEQGQEYPPEDVIPQPALREIDRRAQKIQALDGKDGGCGDFAQGFHIIYLAIERENAAGVSWGTNFCTSAGIAFLCALE